MKVFVVQAGITNLLDVMVIAEDKDQAKKLVSKAINTSEAEFDYINPSEHTIENVYPIEITDKVLKDIADYGIINDKAELVYNTNIIKLLEKENKKREHEEWLKKYHLEFKFE